MTDPIRAYLDVMYEHGEGNFEAVSALRAVLQVCDRDPAHHYLWAVRASIAEHLGVNGPEVNGDVG